MKSSCNTLKNDYYCYCIVKVRVSHNLFKEINKTKSP